MLVIAVITVILTLLVAFAVIFKGDRRLSNVSFSVGLLATAVVVAGDYLSITSPEDVLLWKMWVMPGEAVMVTAWLLFSVSFARAGGWSTVNRFSKFLFSLSPLFFAALFIVVPVEDFFYSPDFAAEKILFLNNPGYLLNIILLMYCVLSIIHLEITLRSSSGSEMWHIKYTILGAGGILAQNIFYYSHALLYRSLNMNLLPVRTGIILVSMLLIIFSLMKQNALRVEVSVSRWIIYRSVSLFIIGIYLLGLGILGEGMRYLGPQLGRNITTFLGFAGAVLILIVLLSERVRRKTIVFINKNFFGRKYDYRKEWLQFTERISLKHSFDELLLSLAEGFKDAIGARHAAIWLKKSGNGGYVCAATTNISPDSVSLDETLLSILKDRQWIFNLEDPECQKAALNNKEFLMKTDAMLIVPLLNVSDLIGFVITGRGIVSDEYNFEDYDLLKTLARQATTAIMNARLTEELSEAREMEAVGRLSAFIMHDLKNAASMLSLVVQNAEEHIENPEFQKDSIRSIMHSTEKIKQIIERLRALPGKIKLISEYNDLGICAKSAMAELRVENNPHVSYEETEAVQTLFDREQIHAVIINLLMNALDATGRRQEIKITVGKDHTMSFVSIADKGCGMTKEFIEHRLFRPFETTKKKGLGIGLFQCKAIIEAHGGRITVMSQEGKGSEFVLFLPLAKNE